MRAVVLVFSVVFCSSGWAASLASELAGCRSTTDEGERLRCYDSVAERAAVMAPQAAPGTADSSGSATDKPVAAGAAAGNFGLEYNVKEATEQISSTITEVDKNAMGGLVLTLANGQIWQQSGSERLFLDPGDAVTIHRGALSAFYLTVGDKGRRYRFARVR